MKRILVFVSLLSSINSGLNAQDAPPAIHVEVRGTGTPVVLLPGFSCPGAVWEEIVRELEGDHECHIVTYAGFGRTPPIEFPWLPQLEAYLFVCGRRCGYGGETIGECSLEPHLASILDVYL